MTRNRLCLLVAAVAGLAALPGASAQAQTCGTPNKPCVYAVKFVCGFQAPLDAEVPIEPPVKPGNYATAVNVQNFHNAAAKITVRAVIANPAGQPLAAPGPVVNGALKPLEAIEFDCRQIAEDLVKTTPKLPPFIKGFVDITSSVILSVVGVYTAAQAGGEGKAPVSIDVVPQQPFAP
ncbi:MAG TPA: hypothetical protein VL244_07750 [Alphaproteobacteria bacterium]|nr:hypothetical protein [Alphaproteobacteria bacterium]